MSILTPNPPSLAVPLGTYLRFFWRTFRRLQATVADTPDGHPAMPAFFRFMTLLALNMFSAPELGVDVAIIEVGIGGRLDATNVIEHPVVCGVTLIDYDHMHT